MSIKTLDFNKIYFLLPKLLTEVKNQRETVASTRFYRWNPVQILYPIRKINSKTMPFYWSILYFRHKNCTLFFSDADMEMTIETKCLEYIANTKSISGFVWIALRTYTFSDVEDTREANVTSNPSRDFRIFERVSFIDNAFPSCAKY